jgi:hypothetical protein
VERLTQTRPSGNGGMAMGQLVGLAEVAQYLRFVSRGRRPGNRMWELIRAGRLRGLPHVRIGRSYRSTCRTLRRG